MVVQPIGVELKFSFIKVALVDELDVALDVKLTLPPIHIDDALVFAVTDVGIGLTTIVLDAVSIPQEPPLVVKVKVAVPE